MSLKDEYDIDLQQVVGNVDFQPGEVVAWQYQHCTGRNYTTITKYGIFIGRIRYTKRRSGKKLAMVQFEGNKRPSRVPLDDLYAMRKKSHLEEDGKEG